MKINNENKAKFFAQYWGKEIVAHEFISAGENAVVGSVIFRNLDNWHLELKPISDISDEDAIDVAKINTSIHWNNGLTPNVWKNSFGKTIVSNGTGIIDKYGQTIISENYLSYTQVDLLRSRGYLVPWMGLSCEEIIKAGWAKYKE